MKIRVRLELSKTTKNTYRYDTQQEDAAVKSLYIQKNALAEQDPPGAIIVTAAAEE